MLRQGAAEGIVMSVIDKTLTGLAAPRAYITSLQRGAGPTIVGDNGRRKVFGKRVTHSHLADLMQRIRGDLRDISVRLQRREIIQCVVSAAKGLIRPISK
jgi:hypothetical protein